MQRLSRDCKNMVGLRTQRLSIQEFYQEYSRNEALRSILSKGQFHFIDGYFIINNPKYVTVTADSKKAPIMTKYAREHLDECAIGFIYRRQNKGTPQSLADILFRRQEESSYEAEATYINDSSNSAVLSKAAYINSHQTELGKRYAEFRNIKLTYSLGDAIKTILKSRNIQVQEAAWQSGLAVSQVTRLQTDKHKHGLKILVQFCIGLKLEPYISYDLIAKAGISVSYMTEEQFPYLMVLDTMRDHDIDDINIYLESIGAEPFNIAK